MARQRSFIGIGYGSNEEWYYEPCTDVLEVPQDDLSPSESIWKKFDLGLTPPISPYREDIDQYDEFLPDFDDANTLLHLKTPIFDEDWLSATMNFESNCSKSKLIQDCMWSGSDEELARTNRSRKMSLSELTMQTASTAIVDPTTFAANPKHQNQLEHSYSLTTPEPNRIPSLITPSSTDESESEEDVIDVVTVDTRTHGSLTQNNNIGNSDKARINAQFKVQSDLQAVVRKLNDSCKRRSSDHDFVLPSKKSKRQISSSVMSSQNNSDSEDFEGRRSAHNVMERQRRNDLKKMLHMLRDCLPTLETQERAPKVVILAHATDYVREMQKQENRLLLEYKEQRVRNKALREHLENLQSRASFVTL